MNWTNVPEEALRLQFKKDGMPTTVEQAETLIESAHDRAGVLTHATVNQLHDFYRSCVEEKLPVATSVISALMFGANFVETIIEMGVKSGADEEELLSLAERCFPLILRKNRLAKLELKD